MIYRYRGLQLGPSLTVTQGEYDVLPVELKKEYTPDDNALEDELDELTKLFNDSVEDDYQYDGEDEDIDDENNPDEGDDLNLGPIPGIDMGFQPRF